MRLFAVLFVLLFAPRGFAEEAPEILVLLHDSGRIERYDSNNGKHMGTLLTGLPPANQILNDADGRLLISTGKPGEKGTVLRYDPGNGGSVETLIDVPEGYGGQLFRASGMVFQNGSLLVASQGDGRIKRYSYPKGVWEEDVAFTTPGSVTQIAIAQDRLFLTDFASQAVRRAPFVADATVAPVWANQAGHSPWGLAIEVNGVAYWSTSGNRILRTADSGTTEWAGSSGELATPIGLCVGPDHTLYCASLFGKVTVWSLQDPEKGILLRTIGGDEMQSPISVIVSPSISETTYHYQPVDVSQVTPEKVEYFEAKIRPLLQTHCLECHGPDLQEGGLRLDSHQAWRRGGKTGAVIVPGKPQESLLVRAVQYLDKDLQMPPEHPMSAADVAALEHWIATGAIDPREATSSLPPASVSAGADPWEEEFQERLDWWSLKPLSSAEPPWTADALWGRNPVDRFLKTALSNAGLEPSAPADPATLVRRMSLVVTGLPPAPELHDEFLVRWEQDSDSAVEWLADRLLASPHFGERFARHWMDAARYTDTYGYEWDNPAKGSWEYRDYLIRAFNSDVGYDALVREQIAGDLLPAPRINEADQLNESLIGPMFYHLGEHRHGSSLAFNGIHQEMVNNKIDAFSRVFLATSVACARCHNHKLEAISQKDYYSLGAVFITPRWSSRPIDSPARYESSVEQLASLREKIRQRLALKWQGTQFDAEQWVPLVESLVQSPAIEDVRWPLWMATRKDKSPAEQWMEMLDRIRSETAARTEANRPFQTLMDFSAQDLPNGWVMEGAGFETGRVSDGTLLISLDGDNAVNRLLHQGIHSNALSSKLPGVLRMPPQHEVPGKFTSVLLAGEEYSGTLVLDENSFQNETVAFLKQPDPAWRSYADAALINGVTRVTIDFATSLLNANFPPRTGLAPGLPNNDLGYDKRSWLSILKIVTHESGGTPQSELPHLNSLAATSGDAASDDAARGDLPSSESELQSRMNTWLEGPVRRWCSNQLQTGDVDLMNWLLANGLLSCRLADDPELKTLVEDYRRIESSMPFPRAVNSMDERETQKARLYFNIRGNVDAPGELIPPDFLSMFANRNTVANSANSGRLELAESLLAPDHPLTSRVYANRLWQWVFGRGLVATPDDFGHLGDRPSNPELLDWLARELMRQNWSTKSIVRMLLTSQAFRQGGHAESAALQRDPANRLLHHFATRRMEAEAIRDALLFVSGRLDQQLYGRPINPPRLVEDGSKRLYSGPIDGNGRRSLYLTMSIMDPPKFLTTFDLPDLKLPSGKRNVTNVPAQALLMLNDPFVHQMAQFWGASLVKEEDADVETRVRRMFLRAFSRIPAPDELRQWCDFVDQLRSGTPVMSDEIVWKEIAHTMFNSPEFIYFR